MVEMSPARCHNIYSTMFFTLTVPPQPNKPVYLIVAPEILQEQIEFTTEPRFSG
jgi:hypothetical protein